MEEALDYDKLRSDLISYYGAAIHNGFPMAVIELNEVYKATNDKLVQLAFNNGFNLNEYVIGKRL